MNQHPAHKPVVPKQLECGKTKASGNHSGGSDGEGGCFEAVFGPGRK